MTRILALLFYKILIFLDKLLYILTKKKFLFWFKDFFHKDSYIEQIISHKKVSFFIPNTVSEERVKTLFTKEPETINWINSFDNNKDFIFWDIGSNIGQYSIYAALTHDKCHTISFEPSTSNLRVLSRNISINNLHDRIDIYSLPLSDSWGGFLLMNEKNFDEGRAQNSFGESIDFQGKGFSPKNKYKLASMNIEKLINEKVLKMPNYIKIDVDGIELQILKGAKNVLESGEIRSISIEINEARSQQFEEIKNLLEKNKYAIDSKGRSPQAYDNNIKFSEQYNYIFKKIIN